MYLYLLLQSMHKNKYTYTRTNLKHLLNLFPLSHPSSTEMFPHVDTNQQEKLRNFLSTPVFPHCHFSVSQTRHITWPILSSFLLFRPPSPPVLSFCVFLSSLWLVSHLPHTPSELYLMPAAQFCHLTSDYCSTAPL